MYQSTDRLVDTEQGASKNGYQAIEGGGGATPGNDSQVPDVPQSFLSQVKRAKEESVGCCNFCLAFFALLISSIVWTLVIIVVITVPIVMIVIGAEYFHSCPVQRMIPIAVVVAGCVGLLSNVLNFVDRFRRFARQGLQPSTSVVGWVNVFLNLFLLAWFIATCYWVYGADVSFDEAKPNFCDSHLYGFVYWLLNFVFIFFGAVVVVSGLMMCFALMCW